MRVDQQELVENPEEVVEEVEDAGAQAGPSESRNQEPVEELERLEEGLDRPEKLENMIVVAEEMAMGSGIREITQKEGIIIPNRELQELHLGEDPLRVSRRRNFSPISFDIPSEPEMGGGPIRDSRSGWQSSRGNPANRCSRIRTTPYERSVNIGSTQSRTVGRQRTLEDTRVERRRHWQKLMLQIGTLYSLVCLSMSTSYLPKRQRRSLDLSRRELGTFAGAKGYGKRNQNHTQTFLLASSYAKTPLLTYKFLKKNT
ncbi:hypothetical protein Avbf_13589 [Armadillidium vulgare]|nr:hypothetical protein Avbf_13589 [Armadillidium vulgare]